MSSVTKGLRRGVILAIAAAVATQVTGQPTTEFFVDFDGTPGVSCDDANPGTSIAAPWCNLPDALNASGTALPGPWATIPAGAIISIKAGSTHTNANGGGALRIAGRYVAGTDAAPITIRKHPTWGTGAYASVVGTGMSAGALIAISTDGITLDGLEGSLFNGTILHLNAAYDTLVTRGSFHDNGTGSLVWVTGCAPGRWCNVRIVDNDVYRAPGQGGITLWGSDGEGILIDGNRVHDICGQGNFDAIQVGGGSAGADISSVVVTNNTVYNHGYDSIYDLAGARCAAGTNAGALCRTNSQCPGSSCAHVCGAGSDHIDGGGHGCHGRHYVARNHLHGTIYNAGLLKTQGTGFDNCAGPLDSYGLVQRNELYGVGVQQYGTPNDTVFAHNTIVNPGNYVLSLKSDRPPPKNTYRTDSYGTGPLGTTEYGDVGRMVWRNNVGLGQTGRLMEPIATTGQPAPPVLTNDSIILAYNLYNAFSLGIYWYPCPGNACTFYGSFASYQASNGPSDFPERHSILSGLTTAQILVDPTNQDFRLTTGSPAKDAAGPLTLTVGASGGAGSDLVTAGRSTAVFGGYCNSSGTQCLGTPNTIRIGGGPPIQIKPGGVDELANTIRLVTPTTWVSGARVDLDYNGTAPDMGAIEAPAGSPTPTATVTQTPTPTGATGTPTPTPTATGATPSPTATGTPGDTSPSIAGGGGWGISF